MTSKALDDFIDDCFIDQDPICNLYRDDSIWLDNYASDLLEKMTQSIEKDIGRESTKDNKGTLIH